jgi:hypothetical protein
MIEELVSAAIPSGPRGAGLAGRRGVAGAIVATAVVIAR